jgi:hypothetical protein
LQNISKINRTIKEHIDKETLAAKGGMYQIFVTIEAGSIFGGYIDIDMPRPYGLLRRNQNPRGKRIGVESQHSTLLSCIYFNHNCREGKSE